MLQQMRVIKDVKGGMSVVQKTKDKLSQAPQQDNKRQQKGVGDLQKGSNLFPGNECISGSPANF